MKKTDAKYMVYLHQDVFIIETNFIIKIVDIFNIDSSISMLGMVGIKKLPKSAIMWENKQRVGCVGFSIIETVDNYSDLPMEHIYTEVKTVDGFLIMTNRYDTNWRTDIFGESDFYDIYRLIEYREKGIKLLFLTNQNREHYMIVDF